MMPWPQIAFHYTYAKHLTSVSHASYCLAMQHTNYFLPKDCKMNSALTTRQLPSSSSSPWYLPSWLQKYRRRYTYRDNYVMFFHDLQRLIRQKVPKTSPCYFGTSGNNARFCEAKLRQHYNEYAYQVKSGQRPKKIDWQNSIDLIDSIMSSQSSTWNVSSSCPSLLDGSR